MTTPRQRTTAEEFCRRFSDVEGRDLRASALALYDSPGDHDVVADLVRELEQHGSFEHPVVVGGGRLLNGTHRVAAALLRAGDIEYEEERPTAELACTAVEMCLTRLDGGMPSEEEFEAAYFRLRSFRSPSGWVEADVGGWTRGPHEWTMHLYWYCPADADAVATALSLLEARGLVGHLCAAGPA